jgi:hypothetical protein
MIHNFDETDILFVVVAPCLLKIDTLLRQLGSICQSTNFCFGITELLAAAYHGHRAEA